MRETNVLLSLHNPNIVRVLEMVVGKTLDKVYMVMEYFDHDLKSVMRHMRHEKVSRSVNQTSISFSAGRPAFRSIVRMRGRA